MTIQAWTHPLRGDACGSTGRARGLLLALLLALVVLPTRASALDDDPPGGDDPPELGCLDESECDDGNPCNGQEVCIITETRARCSRGRPINCNDSDPCTADLCVPALGDCRHLPIFDCVPPTTTTSTTEPTATTTSTTTRPGTSTTTTTLPAADSCVPGTADCDDGDPCTRDDCTPDGTCAAVPFTGITAVTCACERIVPTDCGGVLPARIEKVVARACFGAERAATEEGARQRRLLKAAQRAFGVAARRTAQLTRKELVSAACGSVLGGQLLDAQVRAEAARAAQ